jgi:hypothetical protein
VRTPRRPEQLRGRIFRARDVLGAGLLTRDALRSSAWRRLYRGIYADATLPDGPGLRIAGAALLLPREAVFSGRTAAFLLGARDLSDVASPVDVTVPPGRRFGPVTGLRIREAPLPDVDLRGARGFGCTTAVRTAVDIARHEPTADAVPALDLLFHLGIAVPEEVAAAVAALPIGRGTHRARDAVALADGRAESPQESRLRMVLTLAGLPPVPQHVVRTDDGTFVARVDLAYPDLRIAIEYDGLWHADGEQFRKDRRRLNALVAAGWIVLHVTAGDLHHPQELVDRVRRLLARRQLREVGLLTRPEGPTSRISGSG